MNFKNFQENPQLLIDKILNSKNPFETLLLDNENPSNKEVKNNLNMIIDILQTCNLKDADRASSIVNKAYKQIDTEEHRKNFKKKPQNGNFLSIIFRPILFILSLIQKIFSIIFGCFCKCCSICSNIYFVILFFSFAFQYIQPILSSAFGFGKISFDEASYFIKFTKPGGEYFEDTAGDVKYYAPLWWIKGKYGYSNQNQLLHQLRDYAKQLYKLKQDICKEVELNNGRSGEKCSKVH